MRKVLFFTLLAATSCTTLKPLTGTYSRHQSISITPNTDARIEKIIDFLLNKNFRIENVYHNTITTQPRSYTTTVSPENSKKEKTYFVANCMQECPVVTFVISIQIIDNKINMHYSSISTTPDVFTAQPTEELLHELREFLNP
jgi:hypothetical protein